MKVKSESEVIQLCPTLSNPMACSLPGSSIHGIFQARVLESGAIAFSIIPGGSAVKNLPAMQEPPGDTLKEKPHCFVDFLLLDLSFTISSV